MSLAEGLLALKDSTIEISIKNSTLREQALALNAAAFLLNDPQFLIETQAKISVSNYWRSF
jgi:hypothetical protein